MPILNSITLTNPDTQDIVPVGTKMDKLSGRVIDHGRRAVMGALAGFAVIVSTPSVAQDMIAVKAEAPQGALAPNPEYDRIIAEAGKNGQNVLKYAKSIGKDDDFLMDLGEYMVEQKKKAAIARRVQEGQLDQAAITRRAEINALDAKKTELLVRVNNENIKLIRLIEERKNKGLLNQTDKAKLMEIYDDKKTTSEEVRELIRRKFGDVLSLGDLMAKL